MKKPAFLRKKYPRFVYKSYDYKIVGHNLKACFNFRIEPEIKFKPEITIKNISPTKLKKIGVDSPRELNNLVFHLGLMEIPSYWKATCSPEILIRAGFLAQDQIDWWKDLIMKGLGQFFYENNIDWRGSDFLKITVNLSLTAQSLAVFSSELKNRYLVPLGGGKDSIVALEKLKKQKKQVNCFLVNPTKAAKKVLRVAGIKNPIVVERKIDPVLLKLNKKGYLNGHTPFTAVLSFLSVLGAALFDYQNIAFSNEKSANEGNVKYLGKIVNHQYSKSSEFERKFKGYCQKYLAKNINYFSYLRRYTELEIAEMFTQYPKYFPVFSSCNVGSEMGERWCGNCSKCLFVYATLYPYLEKKELLRIFGKDLFDPSTSSGQEKLLPVMKSLIGQGSHKPFECVGTYKESCEAFNLSFRKAKKSGKVPYLLTKLKG